MTTLPASAQSDSITGFSTPSGNIRCADLGYQFRCEITDTKWSPDTALPECEFDTGKYVYMKTDTTPIGDWWCAGDTWLHAGIKVLPYGQKWTNDNIVCDLTEQRLRCINSRKHGWEMSRRGVILF